MPSEELLNEAKERKFKAGPARKNRMRKKKGRGEMFEAEGWEGFDI